MSMEWVSGNVFIRPNQLPAVGDAVRLKRSL
jgi:hypothetical protein